jgi:hypothetical protein
MSGLNARLLPAALPLPNAIQRSTARCRTETLQGTSPLTREAFVTARPIATVVEKNVPE